MVRTTGDNQTYLRLAKEGFQFSNGPHYKTFKVVTDGRPLSLSIPQEWVKIRKGGFVTPQ